MTSNIKNICGLLVVFVFLFIFFGCHDTVSEQDTRWLIRVGSSVITVKEFRDTFEITKVAYPHNALQDPVVSKGAQVRLLNQLSDEMVILERAKALGIKIADAEVETAINEIEADYPEGMFRQILFESAISYPCWVQRLKTQVLINKVVELDLADRVEITPDDVKNHLNVQQMSDPLSDKPLENLNETTLLFLRRKKAEETYPEWMTKLKQSYAVEINQALWEKVIEN